MSSGPLMLESGCPFLLLAMVGKHQLGQLGDLPYVVLQIRCLLNVFCFCKLKNQKEPIFGDGTKRQHSLLREPTQQDAKSWPHRGALPAQEGSGPMTLQPHKARVFRIHYW